jgi:hypothetical protein
MGFVVIASDNCQDYVVCMFKELDNLMMSTIVAITIEIPSWVFFDDITSLFPGASPRGVCSC